MEASDPIRNICRKHLQAGAVHIWAYYKVKEVSFTGPTEQYVWGRKYIAFHRCSKCGCVVGWTPRGDYPECAVNARMLEGLKLDVVRVIVEEDASVS